MKPTDNGVTSTRRTILKGSALLVLGGAAARIGSASAVEAAPQVAPDLPWKWVKLDPAEAARRGYRAYLDKGG